MQLNTRIDFQGSSGGDEFPAKAGFGPPGFGNAATEVVFMGGGNTSGKGVPIFGQYKMSFTGWPDGTMFDVKFSYSKLNITADVGVIAAAQFFDVPANIASVPEPSTLSIFCLAAVMVFGGHGYYGRRRVAVRRG